VSTVSVDDSRSLRERLDDLYTEYTDALDEQRLDDWVALFTDDGAYRAVSAENDARGLPLATILCEGRGMLLDRATAIRETMMYAPRILRHLVTGIRLQEIDGPSLRVEANFLVVETLTGEPTHIHSSGRYRDHVVDDDGTLRFRDKRAVYDSSLVPTSLIFPL
jgi:3-phenylpropionate/cinnamic acid dioxygenase small subunit